MFYYSVKDTHFSSLSFYTFLMPLWRLALVVSLANWHSFAVRAGLIIHSEKNRKKIRKFKKLHGKL